MSNAKPRNEVRVIQCHWCGGLGYKTDTPMEGGHSTDHGCSWCGGSGAKCGGTYARNNLKKGSGKLRITSEAKPCHECGTYHDRNDAGMLFGVGAKQIGNPCSGRTQWETIEERPA
jgi:hypothetical protein